MVARVAYFINQYPKVSHTFIRREIAALEQAGVVVERFAVRALADELVDAGDIAELAKTRVLLDASGLQFLTALLVAMTRPRAFFRSFFAAIRLGAVAGARAKHFAYFVEACLLRRWLANSKIDHVHAHFGTNSTTVVMLTRLLGGPSYSFTVHGPDEFDKPISLSLGKKIQHARFVVAISSYCRSQLYRWADPAEWSRIHIVRCGLDPEEYGLTEIAPSNRVDLIFVARLGPEKGHLVLLDALRDVVDRGLDVTLTLVGDGPMRLRVEQRVEELGLGDRVAMKGWLSNEQVRGEISRARFMVLPSFAEGLPVVLMEAMALGKAVVATYFGGIPELVQPGQNGWLVPPGDSLALADAIAEAAAASPDRLRQMGLAGRQRALENHDVSREAEKLRILFERD